jgi:hypothetical protein
MQKSEAFGVCLALALLLVRQMMILRVLQLIRKPEHNSDTDNSGRRYGCCH